VSDTDRPTASPADEILSILLKKGELSFRELMEIALYTPGSGYYARRESPIGPSGDYITSPAISPVFAFSIARLVREVLAGSGDDLCAVVDIGCGDGSLLASLAAEIGDEPRIRFLGIDRELGRTRAGSSRIELARTLDAIPGDRIVVALANELYDAFPFARLVRREDGWRELWVRVETSGLEWTERPAPREYVEYLESTGVTFVEGQFADVSLEWGEVHREICGRVRKGIVVVFDYGFPAAKLFDVRIRRYGTAASYSGHQVHRDLLRAPGAQDLTAHVNFDDLESAGKGAGMETLAFLRQAEFLLRVGAAEHPLLQPVDEEDAPDADPLAMREARESARRLVLPDGIGQEIAVLVQGKGLAEREWSFTRALW